MKKILLISFEYPTGRSYSGGVGQIVKQSRNILLKMGHEVYVLISSDFKKKLPVKLLCPNDKLLKYPCYTAFHKEHNLTKFNYIIQHFVNWTSELKKIKEIKGRRPKIFYHFHSILRRERDSGFKTFNKFLINQEKLIQIADTIICPSLYEYDNFSRYFPSFLDRIKLIENNIETFPKDKTEIEKIKQKYKIKKNDILSIYVGRLERIKGAHILLNESTRILKKYKKHKLFIIGKTLDPELYKKLIRIKKKFPDRLFYIRYMPKNILYQYYYLADISVNSSLSESFSLSTHESAMCNNALLLNELPVFAKFKNAALFFSIRDNKNEFFEKYDTLLKNKKLRQQLSKKSAKIAKEYFGHDNNADKLKKLIEN